MGRERALRKDKSGRPFIVKGYQRGQESFQSIGSFDKKVEEISRLDNKKHESHWTLVFLFVADRPKHLFRLDRFVVLEGSVLNC
jgi:hypothetical protein